MFAFVFATFLVGSVAAAQVNPVVKMSVSLPDGQTKELSAPESGMATVTLKDGTEVGIRPTILDSKPWTRVVLTFFKTATEAHPSEEIGSVEVKTGAAAVPSKTTPLFKVAVTSVTEPATPTT